MQRENHSQEKVVGIENAQYFVDERESSCKESRSHRRLSEDDFFDTPEVLYQEKVVQQEAPNLNDRNSNNLFQHSRNPFMSNP